MERGYGMSLVETMRERLNARRAELQEELEVVLPRVEQLESRIKEARGTIERLSTRRDRLAAYGNTKIEIPQSQTLPQIGQYYVVELEPLRTLKSGKELARKFQE